VSLKKITANTDKFYKKTTLDCNNFKSANLIYFIPINE